MRFHGREGLHRPDDRVWARHQAQRLAATGCRSKDCGSVGKSERETKHETGNERRGNGAGMGRKTDDSVVRRQKLDRPHVNDRNPQQRTAGRRSSRNCIHPGCRNRHGCTRRQESHPHHLPSAATVGQTTWELDDHCQHRYLTAEDRCP